MRRMLDKASSSASSRRSSDKDQHKLVDKFKQCDGKVRELDALRLFLRICQVNAHSMSKRHLAELFAALSTHSAVHRSQEHQQANNLQAQSVDDLIQSLYGSESIVTGYVYKFLVAYRYIMSSLELSACLRGNFVRANA
jgi:hypothetical protein